MNEARTQFDYLLNAMERAAQSDKPAEHGYGEKRRALFAYVRELERSAQETAASRATEWQPIETAPKDGTHILAFNRMCGWYKTRHENGEWPLADWMGNSRTGLVSVWYPRPTHWTPMLSAPPEPGQA